MTGPDLVVVGDANPDVIVAGVPADIGYGQREQLLTDGRLVLGGSAAITACGAARLGVRTALVSVVGDDPAGTFVLDRLRANCVDVSAVRVVPGATPLSVILGAPVFANRDPAPEPPVTTPRGAGADRAILTFRGVLDELSAADVPAGLLAGCRAVHAASYFLQPRLAAGLPRLFAAAHRTGATTSLDTNDDPSDTWAGLSDVLPHTDVLLPNERELARITGLSTVEEAALALAATGTLPAVTLGAAGAASVDTDRIVRVGAPPTTPVDAVGAGDSFTAGFLAARLDGAALPDCLRLAVACGTLSTRAVGGTAGQPDRAEARTVADTLTPSRSDRRAGRPT